MASNSPPLISNQCGGPCRIRGYAHKPYRDKLPFWGDPVEIKVARDLLMLMPVEMEARVRNCGARAL